MRYRCRYTRGMELTAAQLASLTACAEDMGATVDTAYSGRAMYGRSCVAVRCDGTTIATQVFAFASSLGAHDDELAARLVGQQLMADDLGLGVVFYWPYVTVAG